MKKQTNNMYIVPARFEKATSSGINNFLNKQLAVEIGVKPRQFQYYVSGKCPIPETRLKLLCDLLDVTPDWLCGKVQESEPHRKSFLYAQKESAKRSALLKYLYLSGQIPIKAGNTAIKSKTVFSNHTVIGSVYSPSFKSIGSVELSEKQFESYINEIESAIEYITGRFVKHIKE